MSKHYHLIGIGGIGVGTLASLLLSKGFQVSGSDVKENIMTSTLAKKGVTIYIGHDKKNVEGADIVAYSSAVKADNPEIIYTREKGLPILKRAELLAQLMNEHFGITIAGAHGKTTTSSMVSNLLIDAHLNPTTAIGGIINGQTYNARLGAGAYFVAEVDESDGTFLCFEPAISVITNIDFEHVDYYHNWENILKAYLEFINKTKENGLVVAFGEDERLISLLKKSSRKRLLYGLSEKYDCYSKDISYDKMTSYFRCFYQGKDLGMFKLNVPGKHNILNALACIAVGMNLKIELEIIKSSFLKYLGVQRRFQIKGEVNDVLVVDDYGHHPTEIDNTLAAAKLMNKKRIVTIFQPHRYTRLQHLLPEFAKSLQTSDYLVITDVYAASEKPIEGVSAKELFKIITKNSEKPVIYKQKGEILKHVLAVIKPGDLVLTLGAGDITNLSDEIVKALNEKCDNIKEFIGVKSR